MELYQVETLINTACCSKVDCDAMHGPILFPLFQLFKDYIS